jgi:predicted thioredoxin/glutaredoxin
VYQVLHHEGCLNAQKVLRGLKDRGLAAEAVAQEALPPGHPWKRLASPSVFLDGRRVLGDGQEHPGPPGARLDADAWLMGL